MLAAARGRHPERFATTQDPKILTIPATARINQPADNSEIELAAQHPPASSTLTNSAGRLVQRLGRPDLPVVLGATEPLIRGIAPLRAPFDAVLGGASHTPATNPLGPSSSEAAADCLSAMTGRA